MNNAQRGRKPHANGYSHTHTHLYEKAKYWTVVLNNVPMDVRRLNQPLQHTATHSCASGKKNNGNANRGMTMLMRA